MLVTLMHSALVLLAAPNTETARSPEEPAAESAPDEEQGQEDSDETEAPEDEPSEQEAPEQEAPEQEAPDEEAPKVDTAPAVAQPETADAPSPPPAAATPPPKTTPPPVKTQEGASTWLERRRERRYRRHPGWAMVDVGGAAPTYIEAPAGRGTGLLAAAGVLAGVALVEHAVIVGVINGTCGLASEQAASAAESMEATEEELAGTAALGVACLAAATPSLILRLNTPLLLGGALGLAAWGAKRRARSDAFRDRFGRGKTKRWKAITSDAVGGALLAAGLTMWAVSRGTLIGNAVNCGSIRCYTRYDFFTLHGSGALSITGAAILTYGLIYRRQQNHYGRVHNVGLSPAVGRGRASLMLGGQF